MAIKVTLKENLLAEEISKSEIRDIVGSELKKILKKMVEDEIKDMLKRSDVKNDISEISKEVLKKLYKDLSIHHSYIIDKIKI